MTASTGILLALVAGILNGSFATPVRYTVRWKWENIWAVWAFTAFLVVPWVIALSTVPELLSVYGEAGFRPVIMLMAFGAGYGVAAACFGLGVAALGIALNFAIALGISTAVGSLLPLLAQHEEQIFTRRGATIIAGVIITLAGILVCAVAGRIKERTLTPGEPGARPGNFGKGLAFAIVAGIGSPFLNFGLAWGHRVLKSAAAHGAGAASESNAIWPPVLTSALVPYLVYCAHLWRRNGSFRLFFAAHAARYCLSGALMGVLWMGSLSLYGIASATMAQMGPVLGWPLFMSAIIVTSNVWGFVTGEWRGVSRTAVNAMIAGMLLLIVAFGILAYSSSLS